MIEYAVGAGRSTVALTRGDGVFDARQDEKMVDRSVGDDDQMRDQLPEVNPSDPQYRDMQLRGKNRRFVGTPDSIYGVADTRQVVKAVDAAVSSGMKLAVRSGGHCIEGFVDDPAVECVIDLARIDSVYYDEGRRAFAVEAGATFGRLYQLWTWGGG